MNPALVFALLGWPRNTYKCFKTRFDPGRLPTELFKRILELTAEPEDPSTESRDLATLHNCMFSRRCRLTSVAQVIFFQHVELNLNDDHPKAWIKGIEARLKRGGLPTPTLSLTLSNATFSWNPQEKSKIPKATLCQVLEKASTLCSLSLTPLTIQQADFAMGSLQGTYAVALIALMGPN